MNGKVNGTMENPMDTSDPNPPDGCENATELCENIKNTDDSDQDNESNCGDKAQSNTEDFENDTSNGCDSQQQEIQLSPDHTELVENENSNIILMENNSGNSNKSFTEPVKEHRVKCDSNDEALHKIMVQKNQEAEEARALGKVTTITRITEITQEEVCPIYSYYLNKAIIKMIK